MGSPPPPNMNFVPTAQGYSFSRINCRKLHTFSRLKYHLVKMVLQGHFQELPLWAGHVMDMAVEVKFISKAD